MDPKLFLQRLSEVSEWHRPNLGPSGQISQRKGHQLKPIEHPGAVTQEELEEMSESEVKQYYEQLMAWREQQPNESVPPEIVRVKIQPRDCEDCGLHCEQGRRVEKKLHQTGKPHWREWCTVCQKFRDPQTGQFTVSKEGSHQFFTDYHRPRLGRYKSKYQPNVEPRVEKEPRPKKEPKLTKSQIMDKIISEGQWITRETEDQIIRHFEPKK